VKNASGFGQGFFIYQALMKALISDSGKLNVG
jgi:hypothetical protein